MKTNTLILKLLFINLFLIVGCGNNSKEKTNIESTKETSVDNTKNELPTEEEIMASESDNEEIEEDQEVTIGNQVWMVKNLNTDVFRNGDIIQEAKTKEEWQNAGANKEPAWCYYDNIEENGEVYGKLYNWYAVNDPRGLAPISWKIPSSSDWILLKDNLSKEDKTNDLGKRLKSADLWIPDGGNTSNNGTNSSGFNGLPGGERGGNGYFYKKGKKGTWWSSDNTDHISFLNSSRYLGGNLDGRGTMSASYAFSVRCLKE
jgi:uncharacterized protein (TIGR02145 family)